MLKLGSTYLIVKDFDRSKRFYEKFLSMEVTSQNMTRWAAFNFNGNCIALFNPKYDEAEFKKGIDIESRYSEEYLKNYKNKDIKYGNNYVLNFWTDDLEKELTRLKNLEIGELYEIMYLNTALPYYFFTLKDPDGNTIEITGNYKT